MWFLPGVALNEIDKSNKTSPTPDEICPLVLKAFYTSVAHQIFFSKISVKSDFVPTLWKVVNVTPALKKKKKTKESNVDKKKEN